VPLVVSHVGNVNGLSVPVWAIAYLAILLVGIAALVLRATWLRPRFPTDPAAGPRPNRLLLVARIAGLVAYAVVFAAAVFGPSEPGANVAPFAVCTVFSVGVPVLCALFGDFYRACNPFAALASLLRFPETTDRARPPRHWSAAVLLFSFVWLEFAYHNRCALPRTLAVWMAAYTVAVLAGGARWGRNWIEEDEGFAGFLGVVGAMGITGRDAEGRLRLRAPLRGLGALRVTSGTVALLAVSIGSTLFGVVLASRLWAHVDGGRTGWALTALNTVGLGLAIAVAAGVYLGAARVIANRLDSADDDVVAATGASLAPVAIGLLLAAEFLAFTIDVQNVYVLGSDPFGRGWNLFGTIDTSINYGLVSLSTAAWVQVFALMAGPVAGLVAAWDGSLHLGPPRTAVRALLPLAVLFAVAASGGIALVLGA
jgi:hypothetical protein